MTTTLITQKEGMTRIHSKDGKVVGVTVLSVTPAKILRTKSQDKDGYQAAVITAGKKIVETKGNDIQLELNNLTEGQTVTIEGIGKGKGFAGTIKRHGFARGPVSHGSHNIRKPGSVGAMYPQHVQKGQKMPGQLGGRKVTMKTVIEAVIPDKSILLVRGAVPGSRKSHIIVRST